MDALSFPPLTLATTKAGLSAGTTTTYSTANTVQYAINGKAFTKTAVTNGATPTTDANTGTTFTPIPANNGSVFVFGFDASGNIRVTQGSVFPLDVSGSFINAPVMPIVPDTVCPFAYLVTRVGSTGSTWTFGSSNLAGPPTGVTHTYVDVLTLPGRPQVS